MMPFGAILADEFRGLWSGWLVRIWLAGAALLTLLLLAPNWRLLSTAPFVATLVSPFLVFPWFLVVMILGISPVTGSRLDALADGILSRPITRCEYLLAAWLARVAVVLAVYLVVVLPAVVLVATAKRPVAADALTVYGTIASLTLVALVLTFLVSLGFLVGTLLRRPLVSAVVLVFTWLPANLVFHTFSLEEMSPISLNQALTVLLRTPWHSDETRADAMITDRDLAAIEQLGDRFVSILSGGGPSRERSKPNFFERGNYESFSLVRVLAGYGLPTIAAVGLALVAFQARDL